MHKWKLFKKSVALVLSSAVIASGMPVTAMASEAEVFSDVSEEKMEETAQEADEEFQPESSEESDVEDIQEEDSELSTEEFQPEEELQNQENAEDVFSDGDAFMAEAGEVLQDASEITVAGVKYLVHAAGRRICTDRRYRRLCKNGRWPDGFERKTVWNCNIKLFRILCGRYHTGEL